MPPTTAVRAAVAQAAPVFLDRAATIDKACAWIAEAAAQGARLVAFPESFVPAYPDWVWLLPPGQGAAYAALHAELLANAVDVPGPDVTRLQEAARRARITVAIGVTERNAEASGSSLYNTLLLIGEDGALLQRHRKLVPTGGERLVWAPGDGSDLAVATSAVGKLGGLICWENYMPLARYALYAWGAQIHIAATWDWGEAWLATLRHIAREGRVYVLGACQALQRAAIPERYAFARGYPPEKAWINPGWSAIVDPRGNLLAGPLCEAEGLLYADLDLARGQGARWDLDVAGHYARPDVFELRVRRAARRPIADVEDTGETGAEPVGPVSAQD